MIPKKDGQNTQLPDLLEEMIAKGELPHLVAVRQEGQQQKQVAKKEQIYYQKGLDNITEEQVEDPNFWINL